jgi:hypothetical protein
LLSTPSAITRGKKLAIDKRYGTLEENFEKLLSLLRALKVKFPSFHYEINPLIEPDDPTPRTFQWFGFVMPFASAAFKFGLPLYCLDGAHYRYKKDVLGGVWCFVVQLCVRAAASPRQFVTCSSPARRRVAGFVRSRLGQLPRACRGLRRLAPPL